MSSGHEPRRPSWRCGTCGDEWPCPARRRELMAEYTGHRASLALYMARNLADALLDHPSAAESLLYQRFLGWFRDRQH